MNCWSVRKSLHCPLECLGGCDSHLDAPKVVVWNAGASDRLEYRCGGLSTWPLGTRYQRLHVEYCMRIPDNCRTRISDDCSRRPPSVRAFQTTPFNCRTHTTNH